MKMNDWYLNTTFCAALGSGLMGGFFFAFSALVMRALERLPPAEGIAAMQSINKAVYNPWFMFAFFGTPVVCLVAMILAYLNGDRPGTGYVLIGGALYLVGSLLVTVAFNIPMNNTLEAMTPADPASAGYWAHYLDRWVLWNHLRGGASFLAAAAFTLAMRC
jgi:uncharacterized membrane protein